MAVTKKVGVYDFDTISQLTGKSHAALYQDHTRGNFLIDDLLSVVKFVARHAKPEIKGEILMAMTERDLDLSVANKKRKAAMKRRSEQRAKKADASVKTRKSR